MKKIFNVFLIAFASIQTMAQTSVAPSIPAEKIDQEMIGKIRAEGLERSKVMDIVFQLTDANGPRLTNSPGYARAANWAVAELKKMGLSNAGLEAWGDFGKGWELKKSYVAMSAPYYKPLIAYPKTWTRGTGGNQQAEVILVEAKDSAALVNNYTGKLKGKVVLVYREETYKQSFKADAARFTDEQLAKMAEAKLPPPQQAPDTAAQRRQRENFMRQQGNQIGNRVRD
ncbi:MAG: peptidase M28, partial [Chitinophagaceae bacterium]